MTSTAVCFDLEGTIVEFTTSYGAILAETFDATLGHSTPELIDTYNDAFYEAFGAFEPDPYRTGMRAVCEEADTDASPGTLVAQLREREIAATRVPRGNAIPARLARRAPPSRDRHKRPLRVAGS